MREAKLEAATSPAPMDLPGPYADWLKALGTPVIFFATAYQEGCGAMARAFQAQADFAGKLAACKGPADALSCHMDFLRSASASCTEDAQRAYRSLHSSLLGGVR